MPVMRFGRECLLGCEIAGMHDSAWGQSKRHGRYDETCPGQSLPPNLEFLLPQDQRHQSAQVRAMVLRRFRPIFSTMARLQQYVGQVVRR